MDGAVADACFSPDGEAPRLWPPTVELAVALPFARSAVCASSFARMAEGLSARGLLGGGGVSSREGFDMPRRRRWTDRMTARVESGGASRA